MPVWPCWQCDRHCSCLSSFSLCSSEWLRHLPEAGSPLCPAVPPQPHRDAAEPDLSSGPASSAMAMTNVNSVLLPDLFPSPQCSPQVHNGWEVTELGAMTPARLQSRVCMNSLKGESLMRSLPFLVHHEWNCCRHLFPFPSGLSL